MFRDEYSLRALYPSAMVPGTHVVPDVWVGPYQQHVSHHSQVTALSRPHKGRPPSVILSTTLIFKRHTYIHALQVAGASQNYIYFMFI